MAEFDVCALGELLIDFTENGISVQGNPIMEANPGGAPCNVLAMLTKLGYKTAFIGKVGKDIFGRQLRNAVAETGIDTEGLTEDDTVNTTLAFVHTLPGGDREFSFYRNPGADMMLSEADVRSEIIENSKIFHYGSLSMTSNICEAATKRAVEIAEKSGCIISFDPNLRENLWDSLEIAREKIAYGLEHCHILKISDNEITWFTGTEDFDKAVQIIKEKYDIPLILLSLGKNGSRAYSRTGFSEAPITPAETIETTGAGDTFCGCVLSKVLEYGMKDFSDEELKEILVFANTGAAIVTTRKGALRVMPDAREIHDMMKQSCPTESEALNELEIQLNTVDDVKEFVSTVMEYDCDFDIVSDRYIVNAKSIMGLFSLNLSQPLTLKIGSEDMELVERIRKKIAPFQVF